MLSAQHTRNQQAAAAEIVPALLAWYASNARDLPWRRTQDPYRIWISEVMLQQTQVASVLPYYRRWLAELPNVASLAAAPEEKLLKLWAGLGYYSRVRNLQAAARVIVEKHGGEFPDQFEAVLDLPGIGRYTGGAICSIAFGQPKPIVDGNVARVLCRVFTVQGDPREKRANSRLWDLAEQLVIRAAANKARQANGNRSACGLLNESLMELGALVCLPQNPQCDKCPISAHCGARLRNLVAQFPRKAKRPASTRRRLVVFVIRTGDGILIRRRPAGVPNAGFWELPFVEVIYGDSAAKSFKKLLPKSDCDLRPIGQVSHTIMSTRFDVEAYEARGTVRKAQFGDLRRFHIEQLHSLPLSTITRKVLASVRFGVPRLRGRGARNGERCSA